MNRLRITEDLGTVCVHPLKDEEKRQIIEASKQKDDKKTAIYPKIEAIHVGLTKNNLFYSEEKLKGDVELQSGLYSFLIPYRKPMLTHHNRCAGEPIGRVKNAYFTKETKAKRSGIITVVEINDPAAIEKVLDGRYFTVSIGGETQSALCSICGQDMVKDGWCEHEKGKEYDGQKCYWIVGDIWFSELSFVNVPADPNAIIVELGVAGVNELGESSNFFTVSESHKDIRTSEVVRSADQRLLDKSVNVKTLYEAISTLKQSANVTEAEIISRWDELIECAKDDGGDKKTKEVNRVSYKELLAQVKSMDEKNLQEFMAKDTEDVVELKVQLAVTQESAAAAASKIQELEASMSGVEDEKAKLEEQLGEKEGEITELKEKEQQAQNDLEAQKKENETLINENASLAAQLHKNLAERVVDMKMALGKPGCENREQAVSEHIERKAESLIDTLNDLLTESQEIKVPTGSVKNPGLASEHGTKGKVKEKKDKDLTEQEVLTRLFTGAYKKK